MAFDYSAAVDAAGALVVPPEEHPASMAPSTSNAKPFFMLFPPFYTVFNRTTKYVKIYFIFYTYLPQVKKRLPFL